MHCISEIYFIKLIEISSRKAPNFAFALAARKFNESRQQDRHGFDLSSLQHMINAAEPVDFNAIAAFYRVIELYAYYLRT